MHDCHINSTWFSVVNNDFGLLTFDPSPFVTKSALRLHARSFWSFSKPFPDAMLPFPISCQLHLHFLYKPLHINPPPTRLVHLDPAYTGPHASTACRSLWQFE